MIDILHVKNFHRTRAQLQEWLMFSIAVGGKRAVQIAPRVETFLRTAWPDRRYCLWFTAHCFPGRTLDAMKTAGLGRYARTLRTMITLHKQRINVRTCSVQVLERIVGPKTARLFILYSRKNARCIPIDTHVLKFLRSCGHRVPRGTPARGPAYEKLEALVLHEADARKLSAITLDTKIWTKYAKVS